MGDWTVDGNLTINNTTTPSEPLFTTDEVLESIGVGAAPQMARAFEIASNWGIDFGAGATMPYTKDILADAMAMKTNGFVKFFRGSGADYTGSIPFANNAYGTFIVLRRGTYQIMVIAISQSVNNGISFNSCTDGENWIGWQTFVKTTRTDGALSGVHSTSVVPSETGGCFYPITLSANVTIGGVTVPAYSKGFYCCSGSDAVFLGIDPSGNVYSAFRNNTTWKGAKFQATKYVDKSATVSFAAGTIGTRGFQTSWTSSAIGGTPIATQIISLSASNEHLPMAFIDGTTVYLNAYRAVSTAVSGRNVTVRITYV